MSGFPTRPLTPPPTYNDAPVNSSLRPYLTLPYLLSLTWLAYPILSLLFIVFRLQISSSSAQAAVDDARNNLMVSCQAAQQAATSAASFPRYMAIATNKQFADAVNAAMNGSREALILVLTCMEAIINFLIDIYRSTFLCFLELAIRGGLSLLISAVEAIENFIQSSLGSIRTNIQNDISSFNSLIQSTVDGINKLIPFGKSITAPQLTVPSLDGLQNVTLPTTIQDALTKLNSSIPSLDQIRNSIQGLVDTPFEEVKADINNTFANLTFDVSGMPVPTQNTLSFCDGLDTSVVDDLGHDLLKIARIGTGIILIVVVLLLLWHCFVEWWKWRSLRSHLENTRLAWMSDPTVHNRGLQGAAPAVEMTDHNLLTLGATLQHPLLNRIANWISSKFNLTPTQYSNLQFFFHYIFHPPALACFLIGFFGILSVELQLLAIFPIESKFNGRTASAISDFSNTIATNINTSMYNQSSAYASSVNSNITIFQTGVNDGLFGWVNSTTTTLNTTLNDFYTDVQNVVNQIFGGTPLAQPAQDFIQCIIGSKVEAFENALTFLHDNLHINLPTMNESALVLSPDDVNQISQPISAAAVGGGNGQEQGGLVGKLIGRYVQSLKLERIMFGVFLGLWFIVVLIALLIIFYHSYIKPLREKRTKRRFEKETEIASTGFTWPPRSSARSSYRASAQNMASFTPKLESNGSFWTNFRNQIGAPPPLDKNDSFNDSKSSLGGFNNAGRGTRKLRAIGRKSMGREILVSDEESRAQRETAEYSMANVPTEGELNDGWLTKAKRFTFRRQQSIPDNGTLTPYTLPPTATPYQLPPVSTHSSPLASRSTSPSSNRPNLTISTEAASAAASRDHLPIIDQTAEHEQERQRGQEVIPGSAWSLSPNPETPRQPRLPWLHRKSTSYPKTQQVAVMQPKIVSRNNPNPNLPTSKAFQRPAVDTPISPPMPLSPVGITITSRGNREIRTSFHQHGQHLPRSQHGQFLHPTSASGQVRMSIPATPHTAMTPVTFLLESTHARQQHNQETPPPVPSFPAPLNPFATPFDEGDVNPFADGSKTPRTPRTPKAL